MTDDLTDSGTISSMRAVAHPARLRILSLLTARAMSAAEVARELDLTHANASYHLRFLHDAGEVEVESEEKIRGGVAKRYRYRMRSQPTTARRATSDDLIAYVHSIAGEVTRRVVDRVEGPSYWVDIETWLPPDVWEEVGDLAQRVGALLHDHALPPHAEGAVHVSYSGMAFPMSGADA